MYASFMKAHFWLGVIAAAMVTSATARAQTTEQSTASDQSVAPEVSFAVADVIRMAEGGTSEDVLLAYVQDSNSSFDLSADQILYLRDIGLSSSVISAMLNRDAALKTQAAEQTYPPPATAPAPPAEVPPPPVAPASTVVQTPAPVYVSNPPEVVNGFYDDLAPYGTWIQLDGAGWCWQPRVVAFNPNWRPYCDSGHWIYTDAGWFWQSDYSWGWAPFHYGRWFLRDGCGWVWTPDRVWGPAWVTWRYEGDHCGWAPLPPHADFDLNLGYCFNGVHVGFDFDFGLRPEHFTFVSLHDFDDHDYSRHCLPRAQVTQIFNHTTVINNYVVHNNTIVNRGIRVDTVAAATHKEFHPLPIHDVATRSRGPGGRGVSRSEVAVYRPELRAAVRPANMVAQKIDERHPAVQHLALASPSVGRPISRPTSPTFAGHRYTNLEPKRETPQWVAKQNVPGYMTSVQHSLNDTSARRYSNFVGESGRRAVAPIKPANESRSQSVPEVNRWSGGPGHGNYNSPRLPAPFETSAGEPKQRLTTLAQDRQTSQRWLAEQAAQPAAASSSATSARQPQQIHPSHAQPNAERSRPRLETATSYSGLSAGANQFKRSNPMPQGWPQNQWGNPGPTRTEVVSRQSPHMPQYYAQGGSQPNWRGQSSGSTHASDSGFARSYAQPPARFSANSRPAGVAQRQSSPQLQGKADVNFRGDAYKHRNQ